jgi:hypothetical protein
MSTPISCLVGPACPKVPQLIALPVEQPAGTGYSYISHGAAVKELPAAAAQVVAFLSNFYQVFPEYLASDVRPALRVARPLTAL